MEGEGKFFLIFPTLKTTTSKPWETHRSPAELAPEKNIFDVPLFHSQDRSRLLLCVCFLRNKALVGVPAL